MQYDSELRSTQRNDDQEAQDSFAFAEKNFSPLYFIRSYPSDKRKIEMSFDLTNYQPQVRTFSTDQYVSLSDIPYSSKAFPPPVPVLLRQPITDNRPLWTDMFFRPSFLTSKIALSCGVRMIFERMILFLKNGGNSKAIAGSTTGELFRG